jgi:hypothetical protein
MYTYKNADKVEQYKVAKKTTKRVISKAREQMYDTLYQRLGVKEWENDMSKMAKNKEETEISSK